MNTEKLIHDYLDGSLDETGEYMLFTALAGDTSLRREFNDYLSLRPLLKGEALSAQPPAALSEAVFTGAGYSFSGNSISGTVQSEFSKSLKQIIKSKLFAHLVTALVSSLLALGIYALINNKSNSIEQKSENSVPKGTFQQQLIQKEEVIKQEKSISYITSHEVRRVSESIPETKQNLVLSEPVRIYTPVSFVQGILTQKTFSTIGNIKSNGINSFPEISVESYKPKDYKYNLEVKSVQNLFSKAYDVPSQPGAISNYSISAGYFLSEKDIMSLDFGRESYGQEYHRIIDGKEFIVSQNPALWWSTISYSHIFNHLFMYESIVPFIKAGIGAAQVGPLGKMNIGINWEPYDNIAFLIGIDGSLLAYPIEGKYYLSGKAGLNYGVNIKF